MGGSPEGPRYDLHSVHPLDLLLGGSPEGPRYDLHSVHPLDLLLDGPRVLSMVSPFTFSILCNDSL
jgi:hypothetical protein